MAYRIVNVQKIQIVAYRKSRTETVLPIGCNFTYADSNIQIVPQYKYLPSKKGRFLDVQEVSMTLNLSIEMSKNCP